MVSKKTKAYQEIARLKFAYDHEYGAILVSSGLLCKIESKRYEDLINRLNRRLYDYHLTYEDVLENMFEEAGLVKKLSQSLDETLAASSKRLLERCAVEIEKLRKFSSIAAVKIEQQTRLKENTEYYCRAYLDILKYNITTADKLLSFKEELGKKEEKPPIDIV